MSQTFLRRTPETEALQQEQAATSVMDQQAAEQDFIQKQQKDAEQAQRAAEAAAAKVAAQQRQQISAAKNAGVKIQTDAATGQDTIARHEDGAPLYESGFTSEPQQTDKGPLVEYRDPRGTRYKVPLDQVNRSTDPTGSPFYEFSLNGERVRQPEDKSKPLFKVDPTTGQRYTEAPDTKTGSFTQTLLGTDRQAASAAAIERRKQAAAQQQDERSFKASELRLVQDQQQIALRPVKDRLDLAADAFDKLEKSKVKFRQTAKGIVKVTPGFEGGEDEYPIGTDAASIANAQAWIDQHSRTKQELEAAKAAHDPLAAEIQKMDEQRAKLALDTLHEAYRAQKEMRLMEEGAKAGIPVHEPVWQKRITQSLDDPRMVNIFTKASLADKGDPLADDVERVSAPESGKLMARVFNAGRTGETMQPGQGVLKPDAAATPLARPQPTLKDTILESLAADNLPATGKDANALATEALGITDPEKWSAILNEQGTHDLSRDGQLVGTVDTRNNQIRLFPPTSWEQEAEQARMATTNSNGLPIYYAGGSQPMRPQELRDYIQSGFDAAATTKDQAEQEKLLDAAGLSPNAIRRNVMAGRLSVQDGKMLNDKFHGLTETDTSEAGTRKAFGEWLTRPENRTRAAMFASGDPAQKAEVMSGFLDQRFSQAATNILPNREGFAKQREAMLKPFMEKGMLAKAGGFVTELIMPMIGIGAQGVALPFQEALHLFGAETEAGKLSNEEFSNWLKRSSGFLHRINSRNDLDRPLGDLEAWMNKANPGDDVPQELAGQIAAAAFDTYHQLTEDSAKDLNTTRDTFDVNKDPALRGIVQNYLQTANPSARASLLGMLTMDARDRETQKKVMAYIEAPRTASASEAQERAALAGVTLTPEKARQLLALGKQLGAADTPAKAQNLIKQAGGLMGLSNPEDAKTAFDLITRQTSTSPDSAFGLLKGGFVAGRQELATEALTTGAEIGVGFLTAGAALPEIAAERAARQGIVAGARAALRRTLTAGLDALSNESKLFAAARGKIGQARRSLGASITKEADAFAKAGIVQPKFGAPLTTGQKVRNLTVAGVKAGAAAAPPEVIEEGIAAIGETDPNLDSLVQQMGMGAMGGMVLGPLFTGGGAAAQAWKNRGLDARMTELKAKWAEGFNRDMAGYAGFKPMRPEDFDVAMGVMNTPEHESARNEFVAAVSELQDAAQEQAETVQAAAGNAAVPKSPRLMAAEARAAKANSDLVDASVFAFEAADELRQLPAAEQPLYTGIAKAVSGAREFTEAEAKALIGLQGSNAVAFQQAMPATVAGPPSSTRKAPAVTQTGPGRYTLPEGVSIAIPPQAVEQLAERAPSLMGALGRSDAIPQTQPQTGEAAPPATKTTTNEPNNQTPVQPQQGGGQIMPQPGVMPVVPGQPPAQTPPQGANPAGQPGVTPPAAKTGAQKAVAPKGHENITRQVIGAVIARGERKDGKPNKLKKIIQESAKPKANTGGMWFDTGNGVIRYHIPTIIQQLQNLDPATAGKRVAFLLDEEIRHAANYESAKRLYAKQKSVNPMMRLQSFNEWRDQWYGDIWERHFTDAMKQHVEAERTRLIGKREEDWQLAFEGLRMLDQLKATGSITEQVLEALAELMQALRDFYALVSKDQQGTVAKEIEGIRQVLSEYGYEAGAVKPEKAKKQASKPKAKQEKTTSQAIPPATTQAANEEKQTQAQGQRQEVLTPAPEAAPEAQPGSPATDGAVDGAQDAGEKAFSADEKAAIDAMRATGEGLFAAPAPVTAAQDAEYMAAVESGDVAKQRATGDAAAKGAGYNKKLFTGQARGLTVIPEVRRNELPRAYAFLTDEREVAGHYSGAQTRAGDSHDYGAGRKGRTYRVRVKMDKPLNLDNDIDEAWWTEHLAEAQGWESILDGMIYRASSEKLAELAETYKVPMQEDGEDRREEYIQADVASAMTENPKSKWVKTAKKRAAFQELGFEWNYENKEFENSDGHALDSSADLAEAVDEAWAAIRGQGYYLQDALSNSPTGKMLVLADNSVVDKFLDEGGYDGYTHEDTEVGGITHIVFGPEQIKSAAPITRDAEGNVIPLSQRFNQQSDSILYAAPAPALEQLPAPPDRIPQFATAAAALFKAKVETPQALAKLIDAAFPEGKGRKLSHAFWNALTSTNFNLPRVEPGDWQGVYAAMDKPQQKEAPKSKRKKLGKNPLERYDLLDWLTENKIAIPPMDQRRGKGEYEFLEKISPYYRKFITVQVDQAIGANTPDAAAQSAFDDDARYVTEPTADSLGEAILAAIGKRVQMRAEVQRTERSQKEQAEQRDRFNKDKEAGAKDLNIDTIHDGDQIVMNGELVDVVGVEWDEDGYTLSITLRNGTKYGVQSLARGEALLVDEFIPAQREALPPDAFSLDAETDEQTAERLRREEQQKRIQDKQNAPLTGTAGEFGTSDMFDNTAGPMALFNQDLAKPAKKEQSSSNDSTRSTNLERDQPEAGLADASGTGGIQPGRRPTRNDGKRVDAVGAGSGNATEGGAMPADVPTALGGDTGNSIVRQPETGTQERPAGDTDTGRSSVPDVDGVAVEQRGQEEPATPLVGASGSTHTLADSSGTRFGDIKQSAPALTEDQAGDVAFIEARLATKPGVLLTNGTGTGKTFSGLGAVKRMLDAGKQHILIVAPSDKVVNDWIATAKEFFDIKDVAQLGSIQDNGTGNRVVVTTYANMGQNDSLVKRPWDAIVTDEAHYLSQNKDGNKTGALDAVRAHTLHPDGIYARVRMLNPEVYAAERALVAIGRRKRTEAQNTELNRLTDILTASRIKEQAKIDATAEADRPKVIMLSATPFAYHFSLDYAEGYLYAFPPENKNTVGRYNHASPRSQFYMENFGYRMRTGKLTAPENATATGILERRFAERLMKSGAMSGRALQVDQDYGRHFVLTESELGTKVDEIVRAIQSNDYLRPLSRFISIGDYLERRYLLEALKARESVKRIKQHMALGRKVVVFHDYKKGGATNPLRAEFPQGMTVTTTINGQHVNVKLADALEALKRAVPHYDDTLARLNGLLSPLELLAREFPEMGIFNGDVPAKQRRTVVDAFNKSGSAMNVALVQRASGKEGISLHDRDGKHQRVFIDLGIPGRPTDAIQSEGRIYRHGVMSNAVVEYLTTGTSFERHTFAQTIAQRASTAENLAMGERARALLQSFATGYMDAEPMEPSRTQGTGGKQKDAAQQNADPFKDAVALYYTNAKKTSRNKSSEGIDYFATPEPLGFKMVEWAGIRPGEKVLEPSAGHGAIARFFPDSTNRHAVEPSNELAGRLALNATDVQIHETSFEDYHVGNKFDAIVMNPPFGTAGKTAMDHLAKATQHLRNGGRIVALIPEGSSMEKRFDKWMDSDEAAGIYMVAEYGLPTVAFERAGTSVKARVVVLDKTDDPNGLRQRSRRDFSGETPAEFFDSIKTSSAPDRATVARLEKPEQTAETEAAPMTRNTVFPKASVAEPNTFQPAEAWHAKKGKPTYVAKIARHLSNDEYAAAKAAATKFSGYYSKYDKSGAIPGFQFDTVEDRDAFLSAAMQKNEQQGLASAPSRSTMPRDRAERIIANLAAKEQAGKLNAKERVALDETRSVVSGEGLAAAPRYQSPEGLASAPSTAEEPLFSRAAPRMDLPPPGQNLDTAATEVEITDFDADGMLADKQRQPAREAQMKLDKRAEFIHQLLKCIGGKK